jgi:hypothetical protein
MKKPAERIVYVVHPHPDHSCSVKLGGDYGPESGSHNSISAAVDYNASTAANDIASAIPVCPIKIGSSHDAFRGVCERWFGRSRER